jgi:hypothetical protein
LIGVNQTNLKEKYCHNKIDYEILLLTTEELGIVEDSARK